MGESPWKPGMRGIQNANGRKETNNICKHVPWNWYNQLTDEKQIQRLLCLVYKEERGSLSEKVPF